MADEFLKDLGLEGDGGGEAALVAETTFEVPDDATREVKTAAAVRWALHEYARQFTSGELKVEGVPAQARHFGIKAQLMIVGTGLIDIELRFTRAGGGRVVPWNEEEQVAQLAAGITETLG